MAVYFIKGPQGIKVGYSEDVRARLKQLQTGSSVKLTVLAVVSNGSRDIETEFHRLFGPWRMQGEWFQNVGPVKRTIELIRQGAAPLLREHLAALADYTKSPREKRIKTRPPTVVPSELRGTSKEATIRKLDLMIRDDTVDQLLLGKAHSALRRLLRGHEVDISFIAEYDRLHLTLSRMASTAI